MKTNHCKNNKKPNLLYVFPDEFRQQAMGFMCKDPVYTPNLDKLASQGQVLVNAVSNHPLCSPYRAMLMTGKYPISNGVLANCNTLNNEYGIYLKDTERCFSDVLHESGYHVGYVGKWHLDPPEEPFEYLEPRRAGGLVWDAYNIPGPRRHSFDFWYSYGCCDKHFTPHYWRNNARIEERLDVNEWSVQHEADVVIDYINNPNEVYREPDKPFAIFWAPNPPHMPFEEVPEEYQRLYENKSVEELLKRGNVDLSIKDGKTATAVKQVKNYFAAVTGVDEQFGRVLKCLEENGLDNDTIVIFTSDHGEMMGSHNRMEKSVWYDEAFLVPFIIRWNEVIQPGYNDLHLGVPDIMPTVLGLMDLEGNVPHGVEGRDYSGVFTGKHFNRPNSAFYISPSKEESMLGSRGVRTDQYTFVISKEQDGSKYYLFDNKNDPYQLKNIAAENLPLVSKLKKELYVWLNQTNDPWVTGSI